MSAKSRYEGLCRHRQRFLREAKLSAQLTIPSLFPDDQDVKNYNEDMVLPKPWQSLGARGTRNLSAKLALALFPPTSSHFRYQVAPELLLDLSEEERKEVKIELEQKLAQRERTITSELSAAGIRPKLNHAIDQILVTGNALVYMPPDRGARLFKLNSYVVKRDSVGNVLEIVTLECLDKETVSDEVLAALEAPSAGPEQPDRSKPNSKTVELYTQVKREGKRFVFHQEVASGTVVEGSKGSTPIDRPAWIPLRFTAIDGEDYGHGYVEEFLGDLQVLEDLQRSIDVASINAAKLTPLVNPNGTVTPRKLVEAENGEPISGTPEDVFMLQQNKHADMQVAFATRGDLVQTLSASFLLGSSFQRNAERVTAEEVRRLAEELEDALGGFYSVLSQDLQVPLTNRLEDQLVRRKALQRLDPKTIQATPITGLAAIGRGHETQKLMEFVQALMTVSQAVPEVAEYINGAELAQRLPLGYSIDVSGLIKAPEEVQQERQAAQQQALMSQVAQGGAPAAGKVMAEQVAERGLPEIPGVN